MIAMTTQAIDSALVRIEAIQDKHLAWLDQMITLMLTRLNECKQMRQEAASRGDIGEANNLDDKILDLRFRVRDYQFRRDNRGKKWQCTNCDTVFGPEYRFWWQDCNECGRQIEPVM